MFQLKAVKLNRKRWKAQLLFKKIPFEPIAHTLPNLDRSVSFLILPSFSYSKYIFNDKKKQLLRLILYSTKYVLTQLLIHFQIWSEVFPF